MRKIAQIFIAVTLVLVIMSGMGGLVQSEESHENPDTAKTSFSSISLFNYYSVSLDSVLAKNHETVEERLVKMPFANIPESITQLVDDYASLMIEVAYNIDSIDTAVRQLETLVRQTRVDDAFTASQDIFQLLFSTRSQVMTGIGNIESTGSELGVNQTSSTGLLQVQYNIVLYKMNQILNLLTLYENYVYQSLSSLKDSDAFQETLDEFLESPDTLPEDVPPLTDNEQTLQDLLESLQDELQQALLPVQVTLVTEFSEHFVGDMVHFRGTVTSNSSPLKGKRIDIITGGEELASVTTDAAGNFNGTFEVPYTYVSRIEIRALFSPSDMDSGVFMAGTSPAVTLNILYYPTTLDITLDKEAYPGYETTITGTLSYGNNPAPDSARDVEIYLDDELQATITAEGSFSKILTLDSNIAVGTHIVLISVDAQDRYAPVIRTGMLHVTRITPVITIDTPGTAMIPGSFDLTGRVYSQLGPVSNAAVKVRFGSYTREIITAEDGSFATDVGTGLAFGLVGSQELVVVTEPRESYYVAAQITRSVLLINLISSITILILLILAGIYLPGRIRKRLAQLRQNRTKVFVPVYEPEIPVQTTITDARAAEPPKEEVEREPREKILEWYVHVLKLLQKITSIFLTPQHTLREFAAETSGQLGPLSRYFWDFTRTVERLLYSRYNPTAVDVSSSEQYVQEIEGNVPDEPANDSAIADRNATQDVEEAGNRVPDRGSTRKPGSIPVSMLIIITLLVLFFVALVVLLLPMFGGVAAFILPVVPFEENQACGDTTEKPEDVVL